MMTNLKLCKLNSGRSCSGADKGYLTAHFRSLKVNRINICNSLGHILLNMCLSLAVVGCSFFQFDLFPPFLPLFTCLGHNL